MTTLRAQLQQKAQSALIQYAIFRWESALVLALSIILTFLLPRPFPWWPRFGWPLLGLIGLAAIVYSSLTDAETNAQVLLQLFQEQFNPRAIQDRELRRAVESALEYQRRIETQIRQYRPGVIRDRLEDTASQMTDWISNIYQLALRLDAYRRDDLLAREREALPKEIERLTAQRRLEGNPAVQAELDAVLESKGKHWEALRALDARMKQAALQLEQSLTALATVYSQVQLIDAQSVGSGRAERLQADIREQVARLNDLVSSINEVYNYNTKGLG
ncbi:hypothetical protein RY27_10890 [Litorilinea aerophila]|nr:hypothetical protein RY27_10890 [Litorilinea aerophila]GIV79845.1 MAG: hypothetical protein KatS3mg050_4239 [Litorilinea sp.]